MVYYFRAFFPLVFVSFQPFSVSILHSVSAHPLPRFRCAGIRGGGGRDSKNDRSAIIIYRNSLTAGHNITETHRESVFLRNPCAHNKRNRFEQQHLCRVDILPRHSLQRVSQILRFFFLVLFFVTAQNIIKQGRSERGGPHESLNPRRARLLCLLLCQRVPRVIKMRT